MGMCEEHLYLIFRNFRFMCVRIAYMYGAVTALADAKHVVLERTAMSRVT
jgi:hypothetical protein